MIQPARARDVASEPPGVTGGRPRALVVGSGLGRLAPGLDGHLHLRRAEPADALVALSDDPHDLLILDGGLPADDLTAILEALGQPGRSGRPAVLVVTDEGRRTNVQPRLVDHADDFVNGQLGEEVLAARVRNALRVREYLAELERKNHELLDLTQRLEGLAKRTADELRLASQVQRSLLPPPFLHGGLEFASEFIPVREIGGDYFDFIPLGPDRFAVALGDVMGKGVPAALLAANLKACLRAQLQGAHVRPAELITRVNRLFWEVTPKGLFASLFFGILDLEAGTLTYVNAGHEHPFVVARDGNTEDLVLGGTVLGLLETATFEQGRLEVCRDDLFVFFSDGITDRTASEGQFFGRDRLLAAAQRSRRDPARLALYSLLGEVQGFAGGKPADDDMTLIVAKLR